jgi:tRNA(His) 5'-end guanylyltransferase
MKDPIGDRMKGFYEDAYRIKLTRRTPVIGRIDGKAFHTLTRGMERPFDLSFSKCMLATSEALCKEIQGCKLAYTQSDEISLLITDYDNLETDAWFSYNLQKMCSIAASIATVAFYDKFKVEFSNFDNKRPLFDARFFNLPKEEVCNYFIWRQKDATRNALNSLAQSYFSHKELQKISQSEIQEKLFTEKGVNFNDCPTIQKRGAVTIRKANIKVKKTNSSYYSWIDFCNDRKQDIERRENPEKALTSDLEWSIDYEIPIFTQNREYIDRLI